MKREIKASEIKIGDHVEINGRSGVVVNILERQRPFSWTFDLGDDGKIVADNCDPEVFIILGDDEVEARETMNRLASDFAVYVDCLRGRFQHSLANFNDKAKISLASAIAWKAEEAITDEFIYNEISGLVAKLIALDSPEDARDAVLRVIDYERDTFINHHRPPASSSWTSNGVAGVQSAARQQMIRNGGEGYRPLLAIIDDFITKEIA